MFGRICPTEKQASLPVLRAGLLAAVAIASAVSPLAAQLPTENGYYSPFDQNLPPGVAGQWAAQPFRTAPNYFQPVKIVLPSSGKITVFTRADAESIVQDAPAGAAVAVGHTYRLRLAGMP